MIPFLLRAALSGILIACISLVARRFPAAGALIASLPLISLLAMLWLWRDTHDAETMAQHVEATFWYVIPSLPMFLLIPMLLRRGYSFWMALGAGCVLTIGLYLLTIIVAARFGVRL